MLLGTHSPGGSKRKMVPGKKSILVVEDDHATGVLIERILTHQEYAVTLARNAEDGLALFGKVHVDLVITDLNLPSMDGAELFAELRSRFPGTGVILCTGHATTELIEELKRNGLSGFLQKPFHPKELIRAVRAALQE
jgi:DNA-binding response OmpR family regulator